MTVDRGVHYVKSGDGQVAYSTGGDGPLELLYLDDWGWHIDAIFEDPDTVRFAARVGSFARTVMFNRRGVGLSDPVPLNQLTSLDNGLDDMIAVLDAVGFERPAVVGVGGGVALATVLAASRPDRVRALALLVDTSRLAWGEDRVAADAAFGATVQRVEDGWGSGVTAPMLSPSRASDPTFVSWVARVERLTCTPGVAAAMWRAIYATDLSDVLPLVSAPTLVVHLLGHVLRDSHLAELIPGARYVEVAGEMNWPGSDDDRVADELEEFFTGTRASRPAQRVLATVVFTDIVDSTAQAARIGDASWRRTLDRHDQLVRQHVDQFGGRVVKSTGDGILATFDGPARACRFSLAIVEALDAVGLRLRAGVHTGEVELRGDDIGGLGVHIASRVAGLAEAGEVLASRTVKDLTAGSGLRFSDRGTHALKGVPDEWQLLRVENGPSESAVW